MSGCNNEKWNGMSSAASLHENTSTTTATIEEKIEEKLKKTTDWNELRRTHHTSARNTLLCRAPENIKFC